MKQGRLNDAAHQGLVAMIDKHRDQGALAVFDFDNTCIRGDVGEAVLAAVDATHVPGCVAQYEHLCRTEDKTVGYRYCAETLGGLTPTAVHELVDGVIEQGLADGTLALRPEVIELMDHLRSSGWDVWVVTASAERIVQRFAPQYGVPPEQVVGMFLAENADGTLASALSGPITYRQGKVDAIAQRIGKPPVFAAGDAMTDFEMLCAASHALVFDRGDQTLQQAAAERGWWLQEPF